MHAPCLKTKQKGAVLILLAFIIGLATAAYLLHALDPQRARMEQDKKTMQTLGEAKLALLSWAVSNPDHPGQMPFPDRNKDSTGTSKPYDDKSDCIPANYVSASTNIYGYSVLLGRLPISGPAGACINPLDGIGGDYKDAYGNKLWYAVSRNVVHKYETYPVIKDSNNNVINDYPINPGVINSPMYPWLKVLDRNGTLISDRVAAVILASGNPMSGQNRTDLAPPADFLDNFKIGGNAYSNADYTKPDEDFIMGEDSRNVSSADNTYVQPYNFNDKLVYITIDELIAALNNRAAAEAKNLLNQYKAKTGQFPYAAPLGAALNNNISVPLNQKGSLPIDVTDRCECADNQNCTCDFKAIVSVTFTKNSGSWQSASGVCQLSGKLCTCFGEGSCQRGSGVNAVKFSCDSSGLCTTTQTGVNLFTYNLPAYADAIPDNSGCFLSGSNPACNTKGKFDIGLNEAPWFKANLWQDYFYYEWSASANLQAGSKTGISALLVATGNAIVNPPYAVKGAPQIRPSAVINDYLDSAENTNGDASFDATNQPKSANYNDQTYVVAP